MMVTFVSQCEKKSLPKTRRVLDAFANRIGNRTWQTVITNEGLIAVKKLLRKTASKNTAVSCHWIRSRSRSEFLWVVGNKDKFNEEGVVPVNYTQQDNFIGEMELGIFEVISLLSKLAGFFHDIGKSNKLFQQKLNKGYKGKRFEPYRHEWVSVVIFKAFAKNKSDKIWLQELVKIDNKTEEKLLSNLKELDVECNPFEDLEPIAKIVAWLILSHHRLPQYPNKKEFNNSPSYKSIDKWIDVNCDYMWNSANKYSNEWTEIQKQQNWIFPKGTLFKSSLWQIQVSELANHILQTELIFKKIWLNQRYVMHLSRLCLMISDHYYSGRKNPSTKWQDRNYDCWANTKSNGNKKQKLDEHNICVGRNAYKFSLALPSLRSQLGSIKINKKFTTSSYETEEDEKTYGWQEQSYRLAKKIKNDTKKHGFFGINMASTGRGKTVANARIISALSDKDKCRFSVALGLRTLTLQTGNDLAKRLDLKPSEYGVLIGSQAVRDLYNASKYKQEYKVNSGSESEQELGKDQNIVYGGTSNNKILKKWLERSPKLQQLIEAPLLVSTIDHLIPATEGVRGGKQIAPMLRLLTSDLILDEPDDFGLEDLPALCRLVNWAGMLGSKVLLSTATMPPSLAMALFEAYQQGWKNYTEANNTKGTEDTICCAWFDESNSTHKKISKGFAINHNKFIKNRINNLSKETLVLRKASFLPISSNSSQVIESVAQTISKEFYQLHKNHKQEHKSGKTLSIGLVRMANINPLVAVAKELFKTPAESDYCIHYCVYHSRYPLALRSHIENRLDDILNRHNESMVWQPEIMKALAQKEKHHIFIVLATSVAEVGRDHDYDWAIAEPSSMRSIIQLAGRIQRHRKYPPKYDNLIILSHNIKALEGKEVAYEKPGFETKPKVGLQRILKDKDVSKILNEKYINPINSIPRIKFTGNLKNCKDRKKGIYTDFVELEHWALHQRLLGADCEKEKASYWWKNEPTWCAEIQKNQPFRKSMLDDNYAFCLKKDDFVWCIQEIKDKKYTYQQVDNIETIPDVDINLAEGNKIWLEMDEENIYASIKDETLSLKRKSEKYGQLRLRIDKKKVIYWKYNKFLGVFNEK